MQPYILRTLDIFLSSAGIIFTLPIILVIFIIGFFDNGSPLFFQQRVGKNQRLFTLVKFRTMAIGADSIGTHLIDPTLITRFGHFLRKSKLDELPQLFNVFLGHMSLVGPRPCLPNQSELIREREKRDVFKFYPGITGLAQINKIDMSTPRKLAHHDQIMNDSMNIKLYAKLIFTTVTGKGSGDRVLKE